MSSFLPLYKTSPVDEHSHSLASSIWAPQPQPLEVTWPRTMTSFPSDAEENKLRLGPEPRRVVSLSGFTPQPDIFGPFAPTHPRQRPVGAIGDGRLKDDSDIAHTHVKQLFRSLNLNSPDPYPSHPPPPPPPLLTNTNPSSPDVSPVSTTSGLFTPTDLSPARFMDFKSSGTYDYAPSAPSHGLMLDTGLVHRSAEMYSPQTSSAQPPPFSSAYQQSSHTFPFFERFSEVPSPVSPMTPAQHFSSILPHPSLRQDVSAPDTLAWRHERMPSGPDWHRVDTHIREPSSGLAPDESSMRNPFQQHSPTSVRNTEPSPEPINFLSLLHPSSSPPYALFVSRIIKSSDQQASIFLQQKLKVADLEERAKIIDAICARGFEMMAHRFGNWAVQRCLEAASTPEERRKIVSCMKGRVVELASNCYGCHVLQKALDCEEDIRLLIVSELILGDPAQTLVNKHASHVWSKIMELTWTPPAPPIFAYVNRSLKGKWAALACHETGSLVVQHAFENLEEAAKDGIVDELLNQGRHVFTDVAKNQWGSYCVQHILEHGSPIHRQMALDHIVTGLLEFSTNEQGSKSVTKALKEGGKDTLDRIVRRMAESSQGGRRAIIVDLALSVSGSQLIAAVLPNVDKEQRALLYDSIRGHIVTLRGCKTGSKVIWLFDRMRAYYGY